MLISSAVPQSNTLLAVVEAAIGIKQREEIGGYGHEGTPELLDSLAVLKDDEKQKG